MATQLLTLAEAAGYLGVTADALRRAIARGTLEAQRLGPMYVVTPAAVERYRLEHLGRVGRPRKDA